MNSETKVGITLSAVTLLVAGLLIFAFVGPAGLRNEFFAWKASAYGSDWLVVQYSLDGSVNNYWELKNSAIHNEKQSDGIYFTTDHGVIHLSGNYLYIQNPTDEARTLYLKKPTKTTIKTISH
jgi:hypothetical protein